MTARVLSRIIIEADPDTLVGVVYGGRKFADALRSGDLKVEGDKSKARRFLTFFPLPERAEITNPRSQHAR